MRPRTANVRSCLFSNECISKVLPTAELYWFARMIGLARTQPLATSVDNSAAPEARAHAPALRQTSPSGPVRGAKTPESRAVGRVDTRRTEAWDCNTLHKIPHVCKADPSLRL
jgi:hypothetical protein